MNFKFSVKCPKCGRVISDSCADYVVDTRVYERGMGPEYQYDVDDFDYECPFCGAVLTLGGSIWEYPEGVENLNEVKVLDSED